jgi:hypothetical protein
MAEVGQEPWKAKRVRGVAGEESGVRLRKAVGREVSRRAGKFAKMLMDKALAGNMQSAKLLISLTKADGAMEADKKVEEVTQEKSVAQRLVEGPRWEGPDEEDPEENWGGDPDAPDTYATDEELNEIDARVRERNSA